MSKTAFTHEPFPSQREPEVQAPGGSGWGAAGYTALIAFLGSGVLALGVTVSVLFVPFLGFASLATGSGGTTAVFVALIILSVLAAGAYTLFALGALRFLRYIPAVAQQHAALQGVLATLAAPLLMAVPAFMIWALLVLPA